MYIFYHPLGTARLGAAFIFLIGLSTVRSVNFSTCGDDGFREVINDQMTNFTCGAEGLMEWRLILSSSPNSFNIATCEKGKCEISGILGQTFTVSVIAPQQTLLVINASASNRDIYDFIDILNGSLQCAYVADQKIVERARCHLSYVAPPENVSCSGLNTSGTIRVSCVTGTVFSSRKIYKCHLFRFKNDSQKESLGIVNMMTSRTTERIAENEVKVSGSCQFNTTQPPDEGSFRYFVTLTPSGLNYSVKFNEGFMTNAPTRPLFSINGRVNHDTVKEGDKVHFQCNSIGQPVPKVHIYNQDNGTLIRTDSSFINYSLIADCTDTAIYMCSAWNSFSNQPNVTTSVSLDVKCKPREAVSTHFKGEKWSCEFEVIANPAPYQYRLWRPKENSSDASYEELETSIINVKCESDTRRRYLSRCSLTVFNITFQSVTDLYKVQIINEVGEENFTLEACYSEDTQSEEGSNSSNTVIIGAVVGSVVAVAVIVVIVIVVIRRRRADPTYASPKTRPAPGEEHEYMDLSHTAGQPNRTADSEQRKQEEGAYEVPVFPPS